MLLKPGPQGLMLVDGRTRVIASYSPGDGGPGELVLDFENQETFESRQRRVRLDPWRKGAFELFEWKQGNALFLCGAEQLVSLDLTTLDVKVSISFEYEEAETLDRPWFAESKAHRRLAVATDRHVWCFEQLGQLRWSWSVRMDENPRWISGPVAFEGEALLVPIRTLSREDYIRLSADAGWKGAV